ncbi:MAG: hypothetical protein R2855_10155 [Thermomicrobiales bacterium]
MAGGQIDIITADSDAHSGIYGGGVANTARVTARIASSFRYQRQGGGRRFL